MGVKGKRGGFQPGGGRPKGLKNKATLEREMIRKAMDQRILRASDALINAQLHIATGQTFLYKIEKEWKSTGTTKDGEDKGYWQNKKPAQVTSQAEIEEYLEGLIKEGDMDDENDPGATYYYITAKEPNNMAIDSLQNRVHGKPKESIGLDVNVKFSLKDLAQRRRKLIESQEKIIDVESKPVLEENLADNESSE